MFRRKRLRLQIHAFVCHCLQTSLRAYWSKAGRLKADYDEYLSQISVAAEEIMDEMPKEWKVPAETLKEKLNQLSDKHWTAAVWQNFVDCLNENIE